MLFLKLTKNHRTSNDVLLSKLRNYLYDPNARPASPGPAKPPRAAANPTPLPTAAQVHATQTPSAPVRVPSSSSGITSSSGVSVVSVTPISALANPRLQIQTRGRSASSADVDAPPRIFQPASSASEVGIHGDLSTTQQQYQQQQQQQHQHKLQQSSSSPAIARALSPTRAGSNSGASRALSPSRGGGAAAAGGSVNKQSSSPSPVPSRHHPLQTSSSSPAVSQSPASPGLERRQSQPASQSSQQKSSASSPNVAKRSISHVCFVCFVSFRSVKEKKTNIEQRRVQLVHHRLQTQTAVVAVVV